MYRFLSILYLLILCNTAFAEENLSLEPKIIVDLSEPQTQVNQIESSANENIHPEEQIEGGNVSELAYFPIAVRYVKRSGIKAYSEPSTDSKILLELPKGQKVLIYDRFENWERITSPNESEQWIQIINLCVNKNCKVSTSGNPIRNYDESTINLHSNFKKTSVTKVGKTKSSSNSVRVGGYYRKNGTYVRSYSRSYKSYSSKTYSKKSRRR